MQDHNKNQSKNSLALFDFDGTITTRDSFLDFLFCTFGPAKFLWTFFLIGPSVAQYFLKIIPNWKMKEAALASFFGGWNYEKLQKACQRYSEERLEKIIRKEALYKLKWHKKNKHKVVVVSASIKDWLLEWCKKNELDLIATEIEVVNGRVTGKLQGKNCYGAEKVERIKGKYKLRDYRHIYAYTDTKSDLPMLSLADEKYICWKKIN